MKLEALQIDSFRGLSNLRLEGIEAINLIIGNNDVGKTSILEAIRLFERPDDLSSILRASRMRMANNRTYFGSEAYSPLETFLHLFPFTEDPEKELSLKALFKQKWHSLEITGEVGRALRTSEKGMQESKYRKEAFAQEMDAFFGKMTYDGHTQSIEITEEEEYNIFGRKKALLNIEYVAPGQHFAGIRSNVFTSRLWELETIKAVNIIDPDIEGIKLVPNAYGRGINPVIEHKGNREVPLYTCGDGLKKIFFLASVLPAAMDGILMVDEIETSLQAKHLPKVFSWLLRACEEYRVQLFVTTHSAEAISALAQCANNDPLELACFRIERNNEKMFARRYSEQKLESLVNGSGLDVR